LAKTQERMTTSGHQKRGRERYVDNGALDINRGREGKIDGRTTLRKLSAKSA